MRVPLELPTAEDTPTRSPDSVEMQIHRNGLLPTGGRLCQAQGVGGVFLPRGIYEQGERIKPAIVVLLHPRRTSHNGNLLAAKRFPDTVLEWWYRAKA